MADCDVLIRHKEACNSFCDIICAAGQLGDQCIGGSLVEEHVSVEGGAQGGEFLRVGSDNGKSI